jgi:hypothetical protein
VPLKGGRASEHEEAKTVTDRNSNSNRGAEQPLQKQAISDRTKVEISDDKTTQNPTQTVLQS